MENLWGLKAILKGFELVSGLKVNFFKSKIYGINMSERSMNATTFFLSCCEEKFPFKFLGVKVRDSLRRVHMWKEVINNIASTLTTWKNRFLSTGGKIVLINSILNSISIYSLSFYKAPIKVLKEIRMIQANFLWGGAEDKKVIH